MLRVAVLRKSWIKRSGTPARVRAAFQAPRKSLICSPHLLNTHGESGQFTEASVRDFVRQNLFEFSFKRVDEAWVKTILSTQRAERRRVEHDDEVRRAA
jgi:hypothetical protein